MTADQQQENNLGVLCIGILTLDIIARPVASPEKWVEKQGISEIALMPGGDAANQSIHLAGLGHHSMLCSCIGADINGETLSHALKSRGVEVFDLVDYQTRVRPPHVKISRRSAVGKQLFQHLRRQTRLRLQSENQQC